MQTQHNSGLAGSFIEERVCACDEFVKRVGSAVVVYPKINGLSAGAELAASAPKFFAFPHGKPVQIAEEREGSMLAVRSAAYRCRIWNERTLSTDANPTNPKGVQRLAKQRTGTMFLGTAAAV